MFGVCVAFYDIWYCFLDSHTIQFYLELLFYIYTPLKYGYSMFRFVVRTVYVVFKKVRRGVYYISTYGVIQTEEYTRFVSLKV